MNKRIWKGVPLVGCAALLLAAATLMCAGLGCSTSQPGPTGKYANVNCPISGEKIQPANVQPDLVRQYKGCNVAFSSQASAQQWDKLGDQEKQQKLAKVMAPAAVQKTGGG